MTALGKEGDVTGREVGEKETTNFLKGGSFLP